MLYSLKLNVLTSISDVKTSWEFISVSSDSIVGPFALFADKFPSCEVYAVRTVSSLLNCDSISNPNDTFLSFIFATTTSVPIAFRGSFISSPTADFYWL
jgi:hypothetical protein